MKPRRVLPGLLVSLGLCGMALAQGPPPLPGFYQPTAQAPLIYVRFSGPVNLRANFAQAGTISRTFAPPVAVGLRPGYIYQVELTGLPDRLGAVNTLFPTLEVRGTISLGPGINPADFPIPIHFTDEDIAKAQAGALITKVFYLENPEQALAEAARPDRPIELELRPGSDPVAEARTRGRVVLILRLGERQPTPEEFLGQVPNTVLLPGQHSLPAAGGPPVCPWSTYSMHAPNSLPFPQDEEILHDGGDVGLPAGIGPDGRLHGLDPSDTVAEYSDNKGKRRVSVSNRVCLYAPRYSIIRAEIRPVGYARVTGVNGLQVALGQDTLIHRVPSVESRQYEQLEALRLRQSTSGAQVNQGVITVDQFVGLTVAVGRMNGVTVTGVCLKPLEKGPERPLYLCKWADKVAAQVGDLVTFHIRYTNVGGQPITDVVVSDSLTNRLEYVPGTAKADRENVLTTQANEAGSVILRWEIPGQLPPGQSGILSFQAHIR